VVVGSAVVAHAQPGPGPYPPPPGYPNAAYAPYAMTPPSPPPPPRTGLEMFAVVGFPDGQRTPYLVAYLPLPGLPRLKLGVTGSFQYHHELLLDLRVYAWSLTPLVRMDVPVSTMRIGYMSLAVEGGPTFGALGIRGPSGAYRPPNWQVTDYYGAYAGVGFVVQAHSGLLGWVKPLGITVGFGEEAREELFGIGRDRFVYEVAVGLGYQFK